MKHTFQNRNEYTRNAQLILPQAKQRLYYVDYLLSRISFYTVARTRQHRKKTTTLAEGWRNTGMDRQSQLETPLEKSIHESGKDLRKRRKKKKK
jgi:hypothetical protein